jgi:ribosomal protein S18 acetylase RimI-like enzyme
VLLKFLVKMLLRAGWGTIRRGWMSANDDEKHRPLEPHYYLSMLAVDPRHQGRRIGAALLSYLTEMADRERTLIYLSSTNPKAIPLYRRFGFETTSVTSPLGVPNHHMERKPQAPGWL